MIRRPPTTAAISSQISRLPAGRSSAGCVGSQTIVLSGPTSFLGACVVKNCYLGSDGTGCVGVGGPLASRIARGIRDFRRSRPGALAPLGVRPPIVRQWRPCVWVIVRR